MKKGVTRRKYNRFPRECHLVDILWIPSRNQNMLSLRGFFQFFDCPSKLIYFSTTLCRPTPPHYSVDRPQIAPFFGKLCIVYKLLNKLLLIYFWNLPLFRLFPIDLVCPFIPNMHIIIH